ncbi:MAG TPA: methyl-accepting chemotaxis protein, partial [Trinickia sp.]|uniref:methyl-accepting chemotaxis protein n=1 Tax=Trinickia sp. TaxID=2571163 RepID=UPI002B563B13
MNSVKISTRLGAGFGVLVVLICLVGGFAISQASRINDRTVDIADTWLAKVQSLSDMRADVNTVRRTELRLLIESDPKARQSQRTQHDAAVANLETALQSYQKLISSPEETELAQRIRQNWTDFIAPDKQILELSEANNDGAAAQARSLANGAAATTSAAALDVLAQDVHLNAQGAAKARANAASTYSTALIATGILIAVAALFGVGVALLITRSITGPLRNAVSIAETVARGDLTSHVDVAGRDETAQLLGALMQMNRNLGDLIGRVRMSSESIATGSAQIATGNTDLSSRTEEQAASLEETASSMEELTATVRQNAENAKQGNALAINASQIAVRGGEMVGRVVHSMQEISAGSAKVAEIINVIESIAFQTNILALNAAVEAARAGEQGRGFAVVAAEVRTLAQRSAGAAKEIKELINASVEQVNSGATQVNVAGQTINEVVQAVQRVTDLMGEITAASNEQQSGIEQVNQAVVQMDKVTQQNAALVEEASAAAQSLADQAGVLRDA